MQRLLGLVNQSTKTWMPKLVEHGSYFLTNRENEIDPLLFVDTGWHRCPKIPRVLNWTLILFNDASPRH